MFHYLYHACNECGLKLGPDPARIGRIGTGHQSFRGDDGRTERSAHVDGVDGAAAAAFRLMNRPTGIEDARARLLDESSMCPRAHILGADRRSCTLPLFAGENISGAQSPYLPGVRSGARAIRR